MSEDAALQQAVLAALRYEPSVDAAHIGVTAEGGVVTLLGHVLNYAQKHAAESAAAGVRGVKGIAEEIEVRLPFDARRGDDEIAAAALERLSSGVALPQDAFRIKVEKGRVTLTGAVDWRYQKDLAQEDIRRLRGVVGISNQITVAPRVKAEDVALAVIHALDRSWCVDRDSIQVQAEHGKVRPSGRVRSPHVRQVAAATAWRAPGVSEVENDIEVA